MTKSRLESPDRRDGYDCQSEVMRLEVIESSEHSGDRDDGYEQFTDAPDPMQLRYAARLVWDFCEAAGYHPKLVRGSYYPDEDSCGYSVHCFYICIQWDIPAELGVN